MAAGEVYTVTRHPRITCLARLKDTGVHGLKFLLHPLIACHVQQPACSSTAHSHRVSCVRGGGRHIEGVKCMWPKCGQLLQPSSNKLKPANSHYYTCTSNSTATLG